MKHWTEPNGTLLIRIPVDWQYLNPAIEREEEKPPYGFQPYENAIGCFQLSCYPLSSEAPRIAKDYPNGVKTLSWKESRMDDAEFCAHIYYGALGDQALIGKYIYNLSLKNNKKIKEQLKVVKTILNSVVIVPANERNLASDLDKFDRFTSSLAATHDLMDSAINSESLIEIIVIAANQIDAYLRLGIVIAKQLRDKTNEIDTKYLFQADKERGLIERTIFDDSLKYGIIDQVMHDELSQLYNYRNRVIHRFVISNIKTRDLIGIVTQYLKATEAIRLVLRGLENTQKKGQTGLYGKKFFSASSGNAAAVQHLYASVNDKHLLKKFQRKIESTKT